MYIYSALHTRDGASARVHSGLKANASARAQWAKFARKHAFIDSSLTVLLHELCRIIAFIQSRKVTRRKGTFSASLTFVRTT